MHWNIHTEVLLSVFVIAVIMGAVVNKTNFCTMGAVSDWVNIGDTGRIRSWLFAMAVAMTGVLILEATGVINFGTATFPPYRTPNFAWARYIVGGVMFGIGMTLGSGCGQKTLVRVGAGNIKSLVVLLVAAPAAYYMVWGGLMEPLFMSWMNPTVVDLSSHGIQSQELGAIIGGIFGMQNTHTLHLIVGALVVLLLVVIAFKSTDFRGSFDNILGGTVVGLAVLAAWYVTAGPMGAKWQDFASFAVDIPIRVQAQSYTFISPMADTSYYLMHPTRTTLIDFGVMALVGVIVGSFLWSVITRKFRIEWFVSFGDFVNHAVGGLLMGIGGVLGMGCTIGQGVTGISTLAAGSFMAFISIVFGAALTMKVKYYQMVYEKEASFMAALLSSLVDMHLLPKGLRRLQAV